MVIREILQPLVLRNASLVCCNFTFTFKTVLLVESYSCSVFEKLVLVLEYICLQLSLFETSMLMRSWGLPFLSCKYWTLNCETNSCFGINLVCRASNGWALKLSRVKMALTSPSRDSQTVFTFPWTIQGTKNCLTKEIMARKKGGDEKEIDSTRKSHSPSGGARGEFEL